MRIMRYKSLRLQLHPYNVYLSGESSGVCAGSFESSLLDNGIRTKNSCRTEPPKVYRKKGDHHMDEG